MLKRLSALTLIALLTLALATFAACGGDDDDDDDDGDAPAEQTDAGGDDDDSEGDDDEETEEPTDAGDDDDAPSGGLEEYFTDLEEIANRTDDALEEAGAPLDQSFEDDEEYIAAIQTAFGEAGQILETAALNVSELDPPNEAAAAQDTFVEALVALLQTASEFTSEAEDVTTGAEMDALIEEYDPLLSEDQATFDNACFALQDIADEAGLSVDLRCG